MDGKQNTKQYQLLLHELLSVEHELSDLRQILHCAPEAILITNLIAQIIYVNPAWEELTGYTLDEVKNKNPKFLQSGKTPKDMYRQLWQHLKNNQSFTHEKLINKKKDGTEFSAHTTTFPVMRLNSAVYYVQFLYDITEKKKDEQQRQELLSIVSHELKTPITVLKLLITNRLSSIKKLRISDLELMNKELDRLTDLINETLDISRIDSNRLHLDFTFFDLNQLIEEVFEQISFVLDGHKIVVETIPNLFVIADYNRIKQVLINFLTNALKYSKNGTVVQLKTFKHAKQIVVSVKDEGVGISEEMLPFVFDKSFQVIKQSTQGLGLGLYISAEIMRKHHGKIWVKSEEGKGSTFFFSLPLKL